MRLIVAFNKLFSNSFINRHENMSHMTCHDVSLAHGHLTGIASF